MQRFIDSIRRSIAQRNWFGALFIALAIPDVCGALEFPREKNGVRYKNWFNRYLKHGYDPDGSLLPKCVRLTADDCWECRNACLHSGTAKRLDDRIRFMEPNPFGLRIDRNFHGEHSNGMPSYYTLQIDAFCEDVCLATEQWLRDVERDEAIQQRITDLLEVHSYSGLG